MKNELQMQKRKFKIYMIIWIFGLLTVALVAGRFDVELIKSMGPEGPAILAGINLTITLCLCVTLSIQMSRTVDKIGFLEQWIEADEDDESEKERSETED